MDGSGGATADHLAVREVFTVNRASPIPLHVQIRNILLAQIEDGRLAPGAQIPRERELGERFGVSLAPVRQALLDLAKEGYLQRVQGRGTFVRRTKVEQKIAILSSFTESLRAEGVEGTVKLQAIIGKDGSIQSLSSISWSVDQGLVAAAMDAVKQWRYKPTLLNGEPIEVMTTIDVNFTLSQ